ncbi:Hypp4823 [Branchiostoma lanceolatum]|uniref:Hypp4823 protein n=1 Tax=Branchiostoma lanceolatum TaxID=7740 RepID=A0A8K0F2E1_BRALA|nr:Hypp4823 [Branchiostoma lanceolatum]
MSKVLIGSNCFVPPDWGGDRSLPASAMVPKGEHQGIPYLTGPATDARGSNSNLSDMSSISGNSKYCNTS